MERYTGSTAVTKEEVLAAVKAATVHEGHGGEGFLSKDWWSAASKTEVAGVIARQRGWDGRQVQYKSEASAVRSFVSLSGVKGHLDSLVNEGAIRALGGDHLFLQSKPGAMSTATYYLDEEAYEMAREKARSLFLGKRAAKAAEHATAIVVDRHHDEWESEGLAYCAEHPVPEYLEDSGVPVS